MAVRLVHNYLEVALIALADCRINDTIIAMHSCVAHPEPMSILTHTA